MGNVDIVLTGREMPEWFLHCKDGSICFMVPGDLNDKFFGIALCIVLGPKGGKAVKFPVETEIVVNGKGVLSEGRKDFLIQSDHVWIQYFPLSKLDIKRELLRDDQNHFQVYFKVLKGRLKKC